MILIQVNLKIMCSTLKNHLFGVASQVTCIAFRRTTTPRLPYKGCSFKAQTHSQLGIKAKTKDNCNPLRATPMEPWSGLGNSSQKTSFLKWAQWSRNSLLYLHVPRHSNPGSAILLQDDKPTIVHGLQLCTRFLHMARKGLCIELVMHS
jgi:hypothetical protein